MPAGPAAALEVEEAKHHAAEHEHVAVAQVSL
jgi:hypothetical protein